MQREQPRRAMSCLQFQEIVLAHRAKCMFDPGLVSRSVGRREPGNSTCVPGERLKMALGRCHLDIVVPDFAEEGCGRRPAHVVGGVPIVTKDGT